MNESNEEALRMNEMDIDIFVRTPVFSSPSDDGYPNGHWHESAVLPCV
jgi:hypothetical protein